MSAELERALLALVELLRAISRYREVELCPPAIVAEAKAAYHALGADDRRRYAKHLHEVLDELHGRPPTPN